MVATGAAFNWVFYGKLTREVGQFLVDTIVGL